MILTCNVYLDSNIITRSLKLICFLIKCCVMTTSINNAGLGASLCPCALPFSTYAGTRCFREDFNKKYYIL